MAGEASAYVQSFGLKAVAVVLVRLRTPRSPEDKPRVAAFLTREKGVHMNDYNFWSDLLDTFQSSPDWIKALWLLIPPGFLLGLVALMLRFRIAAKQMEQSPKGELIYSIHRDAGQLRVVSHIPVVDGNPSLLLLDPPASGEAGSPETNRLAPPA